MKRKQAWLGLIISAVFLYLAFRKSDWGQIWQVLQSADLVVLIAPLALMFFLFWLRAVRWRYLLQPNGRPSLHSLFGAIMIGFMSLNLLPFRLGEFIRAYVLGRREKMSMSAIFATIVIERIFDGFAILLLTLLALLFLPFTLSPKVLAWIRAFSYLAGVIYVGAIVFIIMVKVRIDLIIRIIHFLLARTPRLKDTAEKIVRSFAQGLDVLADVRLLVAISAFAIIIWVGYAFFYWIAIMAFPAPGGGGIQIGLLGGMFILGAIALGVLIPSSPGFVGTFQIACITALTAMGVESATAESFAIVIHIMQFIPITLVGIIYLYAQNFTLRDIQTGGQAAQAELEN